MNYVHHAFIGVGTVSLALLSVEALGVSRVSPILLGAGAIITTVGSIAPDLDHPRSFISNTIPSHVIRLALAILTIPLLAALASWLSTRDLSGTITDLKTLVWGVNFLRWTAIALVSALALMMLSLFLYKSLHHRGPLHSLLFAISITIVVSLTIALLGGSWLWGLAFGWGWLCHILGDGLTPQGIPFFWPLSDERIRLLPRPLIGSGRILLSLVALVGIGLLVYDRLYPFLFSSLPAQSVY